MADERQRVIVGVSGATGIVYAAHALEILRSLNIETHLVMSKPADLVRSYESALQRYAWRDTEPEENRNPNLYPEPFRLKPKDLRNFPVVPTIPALRRKRTDE
jgi:Flavoprotein